MNHQQRTALQRYAAAYRTSAKCCHPPEQRRDCHLAFQSAIAAGCTAEQCTEIRRGVDLALALDAYREAARDDAERRSWKNDGTAITDDELLEILYD